MADPKQTTPCIICQGNGTRGQMRGERMYIVDCIVCGGTGHVPEDNSKDVTNG